MLPEAIGDRQRGLTLAHCHLFPAKWPIAWVRGEWQ
jgi:hypothetical protein